MAIGLPVEVIGTAVGALIYSFVALILNILVVWLTWAHSERTSYVALIAYILFLSTATCVASQLHFYVDFEDVVRSQWEAAIANPNDPQAIISNGAVGVDLALWYFRQYAFSVASMLVCFWAFALLQSVYGWSAKPHLKSLLEKANAVGKAISFVLPVLTICLLQVKAIQKSLGVFMFLANIILMLSLAFGAILMIAILVKYIQRKRQMKTWSVKYGNASSHGSNLPNRSTPGQHRSNGIYDRWLMTRFTIAFIVLSIFELTNMLFQFTGMSNSNKDATSTHPDYSVERAKQTTILFLPGPAPSYLLFIVFGTTTPFRRYMYSVFVPKRWQRIPDSVSNDRKSILSPKLSSISTGRSQSMAASSPSITQQYIDIQLSELEKGRAAQPSNNSEDTLPMLPVMKPTYVRTRINRVSG